MKKSIKVLSAIFAIILLSMTVTVPVTAVEYDVEPRRVYILGRQLLEAYTNNDPENGILLVSGVAMMSYNSNNKTTNMSMGASQNGETYVFHDYGVQISGYIDCDEEVNTQTPSDFYFAQDINDMAEVSIYRVVTDDVISIESVNTLIWGSELDDVVAWVGFIAHEGVEFDY